MKSTSKICLSALTTALLLGISSTSFAENHQHGKANYGTAYTPGTNLTGLAATLTGAAGAGTGSIRYTETTTGGSLQISVHLPVDGTIITNANVVSTPVVVTINNNATTLPTYNLVISDIDYTYSAATTVATETAEFTASAVQSATIPYTINLGSGATTFPVLTAGDAVTVTVNGSQALTGTLVVPTGHY